jgi:hypothetical protein
MVYITNAEVAEHDLKEFLTSQIRDKQVHPDGRDGVEHIRIANSTATVMMTDGSKLTVTWNTSGGPA